MKSRTQNTSPLAERFAAFVIELLAQAPERADVPTSRRELALYRRYSKALVDLMTSPDVPLLVRGMAARTLMEMAEGLGHKGLAAEIKRAAQPNSWTARKGGSKGKR